ncbi:MAG: SulP family inorganic anion transporter [Ferruginibacter sp.]
MKKYIQHLGSDIPSAIVVFLIAIPLCLGIAVASGLNEFSGIIGGIVGGIVVGIISGSQLSVSGPAAGLTAIVAAAVLKLPAVEAFFLSVVLAGIFQLLLGIFKLGVIGDYVPNSVIKGMLAAIGVILILKQLPHLVGYDKDFEGDETFIQLSGENTLSSVLNSINYLTPVAVLIGFAGIAILVVYEMKWIKSKKFFQIINGPLVVVIVGILINSFSYGLPSSYLLSPDQLVKIPVANSAAEFFSFFRLPDWSFISNAEVWITAGTLALVASLETLLSLEAVDKLDPYKRVSPTNRELVAQGSGNIVSGLLGGLPLTSVIVRSSANMQAGAKTKASAIMHGILILVCVAFVPNLLNIIPKAALAAILIFTGYKLAKPSLIKEYYKKGWEQFMPFIVTLLAIVFTDLLKGVLIGIGLGIFYIIRSNFRTSVFLMQDEGKFLIRLRKDISFFSKPVLKSKLETIPANSSLMIDVSRAEFIDKDVIDTINEYLQHAHLKNIKVNVKRSTYNPLHELVSAPGATVIQDDSAH